MSVGDTREWVTDEVWDRLAGQGQPDRGERTVFRRSLVGVLVALLGAVLLWASGLVTPELAHGDSSGGSWDAAAHTGTYEFDLRNRGILPATVVGASTSVPGVVIRATSPARVSLAPGASVHVRLSFRVEDCTAAVFAATEGPSSAQGIDIRVARPWGVVPARVDPPGVTWFSDLVPGACGVEPGADTGADPGSDPGVGPAG